MYLHFGLMKSYVIALILIISSYHVQSQSLDLRLLDYINGPISPADKGWSNFSKSVDIVGVAAPTSMLIIGLASHDKELTVKGLETAGSIIIAEGLTTVLKKTIKRQRPYLTYPDVITGKSNSTEYSFPSGHTSVAFATATSLSLSFPSGIRDCIWGYTTPVMYLPGHWLVQGPHF
jgi:membrane-associated phospholipid phosphatase